VTNAVAAGYSHHRGNVGDDAKYRHHAVCVWLKCHLAEAMVATLG